MSRLLPHIQRSAFRYHFIVIPLIAILIFSFREAGGQRASYREYSVSDGLPQSQVRGIFQDSRGYLWICTRNGFSRFDGIEFVNYFRSNGLPDNHVLGVFEDNNKILWALAEHGLSSYDGAGFTYYPMTGEFDGWFLTFPASADSLNNIYLLADRPGDQFRRIVVLKDGKYIDYAKNIPALDTMTIQESVYDCETGGVVTLDSTGRVRLWKDERLTLLSHARYKFIYPEGRHFVASSNNKIYRFVKGNFEPYEFVNPAGQYEVGKYAKYIEEQLELLRGRNAYNIELPFSFLSYVVDSENVLWFTSEGNMYRMLSPAFTTFANQDICQGNIWAIQEDRNGNIFLGTLSDLLIEYDGTNFIERKEGKKLFRNGLTFYKGSSRMSNGDVWFSTRNGVLIWDGRKFSRLQGIPDETQVCYVYEDPDNKKVMLGTQNGLYILDNNKIELLDELIDSKMGVIEGVVKDDDGTYWLSGHNGVVHYDGRTLQPVREDLLPDEFTYTMVKDNRGGIWVTSENGLFYRDKRKASFTHGLPAQLNTSANSIINMDSTRILVGRVKDICIIDLRKFYNGDKNYFRLYDATDGFMGNDCLDNGIIRDYKGRFWILTSDKTIILDPLKLQTNPVPPKMNITGVYFQTDSLKWEPVDKSGYFYGTPENIRLNSNQNKIQITFNGISTTNPEQVRLQYRLEGFDNKWSVPSAKRFVVYEKLPPGHYKFLLKATNADGVESSQPLSVGIIMMPTIWQRTVTIIGLYVLLVAFAVISGLYFIRRWQRRKEEESRLKNELSRLQMSSVLKQFDPHFTFNVISAIGSLIMKGEKEDAYDYITILGGLLRTVLTEGSVIIKPLSEEIDFVRKYCELQKLRFQDRIIFSLKIDEEVDLQRTLPKMTIQLFVENAVKHGLEDKKDGGRVDILIERRENAIEISITDNGIGRQAAGRLTSEGSGNGLKMITGLFEVMNGYNSSTSSIKISDLLENGIAAGTRVRIYIPDNFRFEFNDKTS